MLTDAQVWYVTKVYPERISDAEARPQFDDVVTGEDDRSFWRAAAAALNALSQ